ncbi:hypothetical protein RQP46_001187 [Phenoliferia psychrophenolica]
MLAVIRASDGAAFSISSHDFQNISTLDELRTNVLSPLLQIPPDCLICMNEEGAQLRDDSIPHLAMLAASPAASALLLTKGGGGGGGEQRASSPGSALRRSRNDIGSEGERERRLYVFDRDHLDADPELVAQHLAITDDQLLTEPPLSPDDPLHSHVALSYHNLEALRALIHSISLQRASLDLALSNLNRVMAGTSTSFTVFRETAAPSIQAWSQLLEGWEASMEAISKVAVVSGLIGRPAGHARDPSTGMSTIGRDRERFLGDYVSRDKMLAVKDGCAKVLADIKTQSDALELILADVLAGTALVKKEFDDTSRDLEDLEACEGDADQGHVRTEELVRTGEELTSPDLIADCFEELSQIDAEARDRIRFLVERKNAMTRYLVLSMQRISNLQSDISSMPENLGALDHDLRVKTDNFKHLARLEGLIPAYVATVVEVVRRREFGRLLDEHSQSVAQSLSHLSTTERTRRLTYRSTFSGKLPWEVKGLGAATDEIAPAFDVGMRSGADDLPELGRDVLEAATNSGPGSPLKKARAMLDELVESLDSLTLEFGTLALGQSIVPFVAPGTSTVEELEKQIRSLEESKEALERQLQTERSGREEELAQLNQRNGELSAARERDVDALSKLREQVASHDADRRKWDTERTGWSQERRDAKDLFDEVSKRGLKATDDHRLATTRLADVERQLDLSRSAADELSRQLVEVEGQHSNLQSDHGNLQWELTRARTTIQELEASSEAVEAANRDLSATVADKERLLRDQQGEAELDRAVLEKEMADLRQIVETKEESLVASADRTTALEAVAHDLREQIKLWELVSVTKESEVGVAKGEAEEARREREAATDALRRELVVAEHTARAALQFAGELCDENGKITAVLSAPAPTKSDSSSDNPDKILVVASTSPRDVVAISVEPPSPVTDYANGDLEELLADLKKFDHDALTEAVKAKIESLSSMSKKWSKEAKAYRERAHRATSGASDKIAFRNFTKGDLALFLPTRNSTVPVWAAFNVSFPHHFLSATGIISEQMKSREWIVARITNLTEKIADVKDPTSNPYLLAPGTKYFLLEVEPWSSKESGSRSRKHSSAEKGKNVRPEERRSSSAGHMRNSRSESSPPPRPLSASTVFVDAPSSAPVSPSIRRSASTPAGLPSNATDLAKSEFAIVEEDEAALSGTSPTTMAQPVPLSDEPYISPPLKSPSALAIALARAPPPPQSSLPRSDPFSDAPFAISPPLGGPASTAPTTDFEPTNIPAGAFPAFLPSKKSSNGGSEAGGSSSRYLVQRSTKPRIELASSPTSTTGGSFIAFPRSSGGGSSGSSILSQSMHRRVGTRSSASPPTKALSTTEAQESGSRWATLTEDLASASTSEFPILQKSMSRSAMTIGRNTRGWPSADAGDATTSTSASARPSASSVFESFTGRKSSAPSPPPAPSGADAASEILKRLKPSDTASVAAGSKGWGVR